MGVRRFPTLRAQWLGRELRQLRIDCGATLVEAGQYVQRDQGTISRMESGLAPARVGDVVALLNLYGVEDPVVRADLELISRDVWQRGWWDGYSKYAPAWMLDLAWMEGRARRIRSFDPLVLHGILQTEPYARALISAVNPDAEEPTREHWIRLRLDRQRILTTGSETRFEVIIDEAVLQRGVGGPETMRVQLAHLLDLTQRGAITMRLLDRSGGAHAAPEGSFALLDLPDPYPQVGHIDTVAGNLWVEGDMADSIADRYDRLEAAALPPIHSSQRLEEILKEYS
ncbi:helix-turn-helix protein [Stackebrandtia endophytica]|uniref:Helix-turn-helix protein n=2 Tax=Stackebrandtia endophytica TaxID=1496996 RepID=A0A543B0V1_9ACTN|nr:helix-turn-helix transcriptional regulator [Stackebrandtia endophytica]TQL78454.1 helix-turn-helix protein [Stackebrandtia endophytica]